MNIKNPEALKSWLIIVLEPLCDADSSALARYVLALLKKDKPESELVALMVEQLDVFLGEETTTFVDKLFVAINTEEYLKRTAEAITKSDDMYSFTSSEPRHKADVKLRLDDKKSDLPSCSDAYNLNDTDSAKTKENPNGGNKSNDARDIKSESAATSSSTSVAVSSPAKVVTDKENLPREGRRRRLSCRSRSNSHSRSRTRTRSPRSRSRSRSAERPRRSRSRERRAGEREKSRQVRKSPPPTDSRYSGSHDRRRTDQRRRATDDRSPRFSGASVDSSRKPRVARTVSRSKSNSSERGRNKISPSRSSRNTPDRHPHPEHDNAKRQRCRDFDEKGYCVRGETCPWDHGVNPVVFENINNTALISMSLREYNPDSPDLWTRPNPNNPLVGGTGAIMTGGPGDMNAGNINPFTGVPRPGVVMAGPVVANGGSSIGDYPRPGVGGTVGFRGIMPFPFNQSMSAPLQRELIPIPVVDANAESNGCDTGSNTHHGKRRHEADDNNTDGPPLRKMPVNTRLGPRIPHIQSNSSLELRKVPRGLNTITHLNNHFSKFGKIVNIQISYDGDPEAAIVTFNAHAEANVAYRSTEAVLNNRFIKVFWHNPDANAHSTATEATDQRRKSQYHLNNVTAASKQAGDANKSSTSATVTSQTTAKSGTAVAAGEPTTSASATNIAMTPMRAKSTLPRNLSPAVANALLRKKQEEQHKAAVQLANGLRKRKQELMQSYVKQMKQALDLVERCEPNDPQRQRTLDTVKVLQDSIDKLRKEINVDAEHMQAQLLNHNHNHSHNHNHNISHSHSHHSNHNHNHNQQQQQTSTQTTAAIIKKTKEQQKKELLDIELELFAQQQEGNDTTAIQKRIEELQRSLGISANGVGASGHPHPTTSGKGMHYTSNRPNRARSMYADVSTRVDRRPKTIVITGFTSEEADFVLGHFKHFGEVLKHDMDKKIPQLIITYATRLHAEYAIVHGKVFKDKRLHIIWAPVVNTTPIKPTATIIAPPALASNTPIDKEASRNTDADANAESLASDKSEKASSDSEDRPLSTLPELRLEDEEDDEDAEDRSWRR